MLALTFQIGPEAVGLDIRRVREVIPRVHLRAMVGAPSWFPGVFIYYGVVIPVVDLYQLTGHGECPPHLSSRIVLTTIRIQSKTEIMVGLLAAHVADLREIPLTNVSQMTLLTTSGVNLGPLVPDQNGSVIRWMDLDRLLPADVLDLVASAAGVST